VKRATVLLGGTAIALGTVDLVHKAKNGQEHLHARSIGYVVVVLGLVSLWTAALLATRSMWLAAAGGVLAGGAVGNLVSLALWPGVPNPLVVEPIAFNLADVFVVTGFLLTAAATVRFASRNPERLGEPVRLR
jgi:lipoprotein signal peptidase